MSGRVVRLKPGQDPRDQALQHRMMTTQDILVAEELKPGQYGAGPTMRGD